MEIKLIRKYYQAKYTIGRLYVNNRFFSDCLEPPSLHLTERSALGTILIAKYKGYRAIPTGRYRILITRSRRFGRWLPLLLNVKGFEGIRIHAGNKPEDTQDASSLASTDAKDMCSTLPAACSHSLR